MRILVEAFACQPDSGSEARYGWAYATEYARRGHDVTVVTSSEARAAVDEALSMDAASDLNFVYVTPRRWPLRLGWTVGSAVQYVLWLWDASAVALTLDRALPFDSLHHASYGTLLGGTFLWRLDRPLIFGPVGGGQTTPPAFRELFGSWWRDEALRSLVVRRLWRLLWHSRRTTRLAAVLLASNEETATLARRMGARRVHLVQDVALPERMTPSSFPNRAAHNGFNLLWLGRIMPRKAVELAVLAVQRLPADSVVTLTIVGRGANDEMESSFRRWLSTHAMADRVTALGAVPFEEVPRAYLAADAFIFTSVRDSVGVQILEAMAFGLPVICLDHQGARTLVPDEGGIKVPVTDIPGTVQALSEAIQTLEGDPEARVSMGRVNFERALESTWEKKAKVLLHTMEDAISGSFSPKMGSAPDDVHRYAAVNAEDSASEWDDYTRERYAQFRSRLPGGARRVLDVGCGVGRGGEELLRTIPRLEIVGIDAVAARLPAADARGYARTICASVTDIPLGDECFDAVVAGEVVEHLEEGDVDLSLREMWRVLRPGGVLLLTTPNPNALRFRLRGQSTIGWTHLSAHTPRSLRQRLCQVGFTDVTFRGSGRMTRHVREWVPVLCVYGSYLVHAVRGGCVRSGRRCS